MTPSNANTSGLLELIQARIGQDFDGECHLTDDEAQRVISALVTAASAQAREAMLSERVEHLELALAVSNSSIRDQERRATAAEARADRLAKVLVMLGGEKPEQKRSYPNSYRGGFDAATDLAASIARAALQQEKQS